MSVEEMQLIDAAKYCYAERLVSLLDRGVSIETRSTGGHTPLIMAASNECPEIVRILIERGADLDARDDMGLTARDAARIHNARSIMAMLDAAAAAKAQPQPAAPQPAPVGNAPAPAPVPEPWDAGLGALLPPIEPVTRNAPAPAPAPAPLPTAPQAGAAAWPAPGRYAVGETVRYRGSGNRWYTGVVKRIDPRYGYDIEGETGSIDPQHVAGMEREPFWTGWFVGDWHITVPVATEVKTDGIDLYRVYHGGLPLPPLRVSADGTYSWRFIEGQGERLYQGRWTARPDAPGIYLENGPYGARWEIYNYTFTLSEKGDTIIVRSEDHTHYNGSRL